MKPIIEIIKKGNIISVEVAYAGENTPIYLKTVSKDNVFLSLSKGCLTLASRDNQKDIILQVDEMTGFSVFIYAQDFLRYDIQNSEIAYKAIKTLIHNC